MGPITTTLTAEQINAVGKNCLVSNLGIRFLELEDGYLRATMPVDERTRQPMGILHGGASVALAETVGSTASFLLLEPKNQYGVGLEINANHLRPMSEGLVTAVANPIHLGRTTHVWDIPITNESGKLVCISRFTVAIKQK